MNSVRPLRGGVLLGAQAQVVADVDAANDQDVAVLLNLTGCLGREKALACWNLARFQRTAKGARQSAGGRGDEVVERCVVRLVDPLVDAIVLRDRGVNAEEHGW